MNTQAADSSTPQMYHTNYLLETTKNVRFSCNKIAEKTGKSYRLALWELKRELKEMITATNLRLKFGFWSNWIAVYYTQQDVEEMAKRVSEIEKLIEIEDKPKDGITDDMIWTAKHFPIELLIEFTKGKSLAFCHTDTNPSLSMHSKSNTCRCFVCDKSFDPIAVLMERDKLSFIDAVRQLQR